MKEDIIRQVREAENQAEQITREAQTETETILRDARHQAMEQRQEILEAARKKAKTRFETGAQSFQPEVEQIHHTSKKEIDRDTEYAHKNMDAVVKFVVSQFYRQFESE